MSPPTRAASSIAGPDKRTIADHPFVPAPDVVDEDLDAGRFLDDAREGGHHVRILAVVTTDAQDSVFSCAFRSRSPSDEHSGALVSQRTRDAAADALRAPSNDSDTISLRDDMREYSADVVRAVKSSELSPSRYVPP